MMKDSPQIIPQVADEMLRMSLPVAADVTPRYYSRVVKESPQRMIPQVADMKLAISGLDSSQPSPKNFDRSAIESSPKNDTDVADNSSQTWTSSFGHRMPSTIRRPHQHDACKRQIRRTSRVMQPLPAVVFDKSTPNLNIHPVCDFRPRG